MSQQTEKVETIAVYLVLVQRLRRFPALNQTLVRCFVSAGGTLGMHYFPIYIHVIYIAWCAAGHPQDANQVNGNGRRPAGIDCRD